MKPEIVLIGGGGHCRACIDVIETQDRYRIAGIVDAQDKLGQRVLDYEVIAADQDLPRLVKEYRHFFITVGQIKSPAIRRAIFSRLVDLDADMPVIVSPLAHVSRHARASEGTIVMHHALVNAGAAIGRNCIINSKALIEHDVVVEDHCHISTAATLNGGVKVKAGVFVGSHAVVRENVVIQEDALVGAGEIVLRDLPASYRTERSGSSSYAI